ncbi:MAG: arginine--tRNA ligase [candidate division WOR-3 bacterium]
MESGKFLRKEIEKLVEEYLKEEVFFEKPKKSEYGDYAFCLFDISKKRKENPEKIFEEIKEVLEKKKEFFEKIEYINGFLNIKLSYDILIENLKEILREKENFGKINIGNKKINLEFVSANPTGPLNIANARAASIGDTLANILKSAGFHVEKEYYVNDSGNQVKILEESLNLRIKEIKGEKVIFPENFYPGEYLIEIAKEIVEKNIEDRKEYAINKILEWQKNSLSKIGVKFDNFVRESSIRKSNKINEVLKKLSKYTYEKEGALYFKSTLFEDDKDRVLIKKDGEITYFLADLAYHLDKIERGFDILINIWGPDHHGYINRMKAGLKAMGFENFEVIIAQQVNLKMGEKPFRISKRKGIYYTMDELIEEAGKDAIRMFMLLKTCDSPLDFDIELAKKTASENPVYYLQYMHARCVNVRKFAMEKGIDCEKFNENYLKGEEERKILVNLFYFKDIIEKSAILRAPHLLPYFLLEVAGSYHFYYQSKRIVGEDKEVSKARLALNNACEYVIKNGLKIMGIDTPEKM